MGKTTFIPLKFKKKIQIYPYLQIKKILLSLFYIYIKKKKKEERKWPILGHLCNPQWVPFNNNKIIIIPVDHKTGGLDPLVNTWAKIFFFFFF
jgi:hypothetical protein